MFVLVQLLEIYSWVIILSALASWLPIPRDNPILQFMRNITEPVYAPIRALINPSWLGGVDISPIIVLFGIRALTGVLLRF